MEEGRLVVHVLVTQHGKDNMEEVVKYFENEYLTIVRRYTKSLLDPPRIAFLVTMFDVVSSDPKLTEGLVKESIKNLNMHLPGAAMYHGKTQE